MRHQRVQLRPLLLVLCASSLLVGACSSASTDTATSSQESNERSADSNKDTSPTSTDLATLLEWSDCDVGQNTECATLDVPLDWEEPTGPKIPLALVRVLATGNRIGSLIGNPGGPGGSGLEFLSSEPFSEELMQRFDTVSWDPRGVGESAPVSCTDSVPELLGLDPDPDSAAEQSALDKAAAAVSSECAEAELQMLEHMSTVEVAKDLEAIRVALGNEPLNFVGFSYGTQIGQAYAEMYPLNIRSMVLDGVVDPSLGYTEFLLGQTAAFEAAFNENVDRCEQAGQEECGVRDLADAYDTVHSIVEEKPLGSQGREVGPGELATAAIMTGYYEDGWRELGPALALALEGDGSAVRDIADDYYDFAAFSAYAAVVCIDTPPPESPAAYQEFAQAARAVSPRFGGSVANELLPC
ncbi:MAG: alpha/beta hydrolase, partial [Microthrixaceae bacterium]